MTEGMQQMGLGAVTCIVQESGADMAAFAALASAVIAAIALAFTGWQIKSAQNHNKKMARPHLSGWNHLSHSPETYVYSLENAGLGPAIIKEIRLEVDGNQIEGEGADLIENATEILLDGVSSERAWEMFNIGVMIPPGRKYEILGVRPSHHTGEEIMKRIKDRARLVIRYESILGEKFVFDSELE